MPTAQLPKTLKGWAVALVGALVGLLAGFVTIRWLGEMLK